jgi:hypothetical protein
LTSAAGSYWSERNKAKDGPPPVPIGERATKDQICYSAALKMRAEIVFEALAENMAYSPFSHLTWLVIRESFINYKNCLVINRNYAGYYPLTKVHLIILIDGSTAFFMLLVIIVLTVFIVCFIFVAVFLDKI